LTELFEKLQGGRFSGTRCILSCSVNGSNSNCFRSRLPVMNVVLYVLIQSTSSTTWYWII